MFYDNNDCRYRQVNYQQIRLPSFVEASVSESRNLPRVGYSQNFTDLRQGECYSATLIFDHKFQRTSPDTCPSFIFETLRIGGASVFGSYLAKERRGYNHGSQCARKHGQGRVEEADREHEVPSQYGPVAPVEEHCRDEGVRGRERED